MAILCIMKKQKEKVERSKMLKRVLLWIIKESGEAWWGEPTCNLWAVNKKKKNMFENIYFVHSKTILIEINLCAPAQYTKFQSLILDYRDGGSSISFFYYFMASTILSINIAIKYLLLCKH